MTILYDFDQALLVSSNICDLLVHNFHSHPYDYTVVEKKRCRWQGFEKPGHPEVPEMGGITIVIALKAICGGIAISITYFGLGK